MNEEDFFIIRNRACTQICSVKKGREDVWERADADDSMITRDGSPLLNIDSMSITGSCSLS